MEAISTRVGMDQNENRATSLFMGRRGQVSLGQSCRKVAQSSKGLILGYWKGRLSEMGKIAWTLVSLMEKALKGARRL